MSSNPEIKTVLVLSRDTDFLNSLLTESDGYLWKFSCSAFFKEAVEEVSSHFQPDVAIIDLRPTHEYGIESCITAIQQLAERLPGLPIIALTEHGKVADVARKCVSAGAVQVVSMPVEPAEISERLVQAIWIKDRQVKVEELDRIKERERKERLAEAEGLDPLDEQDQYVPTVSRLLKEYTDRLHQIQSEAATVLQRIPSTGGFRETSHPDAEWQLANNSLLSLVRGFRRIEDGLLQLSREVSQRLEHTHLDEAVRIEWVVRLADLEASLAHARDDFSSKETYLAQIHPSNDVTSVRAVGT